MIRLVFAFLVMTGSVLPALADIPPPPPVPGMKRVPFEIVMKLDKEIPGYRFFTFHRYGLGGEEAIDKELKLGTEDGVPVPSSSSASVRTGVVAVPRKLMEELQTSEKLAKLLVENEGKAATLPEGVVVYETHGTTRDLKQSDPRDKIVKVVTISSDEQSGVKFTSEEPVVQTGSNDEHNNDEGENPRWWMFLLAGFALGFGIITLAIWSVLRMLRRR